MVCPLCQAPRPRGANRCICNYTFEYESASRPSVGRVPSSAPRVDAMVLIVAVAAAVIAGWLASGIDRRTAPSDPVMWFLVAAGLFSVAGGAFGWRWFLASRRARWARWLFGTEGARVFYGVVGGALAGAGIALVLA